MPLSKVLLKPGVNREKPRYASEPGYYDCDKIRFRQDFPEKIGGWLRQSNNTFLGICRSLRAWNQLDGKRLIGVGTHLKFYIENNTQFNDVTPVRTTANLATDSFDTTSGSSEVVVTDAEGANVKIGDFVTIAGASSVGGVDPNGEWQIIAATATTFTIDVGVNATSTASGGGASATAEFQINIGNELDVPSSGFGAGQVGLGPYGIGSSTQTEFRLWNQADFGEDLVYGPAGGSLYYWSVSSGLTSRGVLVSSLSGASDVPERQDVLLIADLSRFVFVFGTNVIGTSTYDPLMIRWSDQENVADWTPKATNQAGSLRLSRGSRIVSAVQARQEVLVFTTEALYSLQFLGGAEGWGAQLVGENITIASQRCVAYANGISFWMGLGKFYTYDGTVRPLRCDVRKFVFEDFNYKQLPQVFGGTNEEFHEVWWFYPSKNSNTVDRYVIYNYREDVWYYGAMGRTAWQDAMDNGKPMATTYDGRLVIHELGVDDGETPVVKPIEAFVQSNEFAIEDGDSFMFVRRVIPEVSFEGSTAARPAVTFSLRPLRNPGSGYTVPASEGYISADEARVWASGEIDSYTDQLNLRVRGRQMVMRAESDQKGCQWQLGAVRLDMRKDGRS